VGEPAAQLDLLADVVREAIDRRVGRHGVASFYRGARGKARGRGRAREAEGRVLTAPR
jgi:hypothetical protein